MLIQLTGLSGDKPGMNCPLPHSDFQHDLLDFSSAIVISLSEGKAFSLLLPSTQRIDTASTVNSLSQTMLGPLGLVYTKKIGNFLFFFPPALQVAK